MLSLLYHLANNCEIGVLLFMGMFLPEAVHMLAEQNYVCFNKFFRQFFIIENNLCTIKRF